jgi:predicted DNA-binding antitoxin AbrB/MazE fold protein
MTKTFSAIFENGVFRPVEPVDFPEHCQVCFEVRSIEPAADDASLDEVYAILNKRFNSGEHDVAARHNEHQP